MFFTNIIFFREVGGVFVASVAWPAAREKATCPQALLSMCDDCFAGDISKETIRNEDALHLHLSLGKDKRLPKSFLTSFQIVML